MKRDVEEITEHSGIKHLQEGFSPTIYGWMCRSMRNGRTNNVKCEASGAINKKKMK